MKKILRSLWAVLLSAVLLCGPLLPCAGAESETVFLRTPEDWTAFAQSCRLDAWSQGKTVLLERDLDISGLESVPTFGGACPSPRRAPIRGCSGTSRRGPASPT